MFWAPWLNDLRHTSQGKGFNPEWVLLWAFKWAPWLNDLGHWSQGKGFSPESVLPWVFKWGPLVNKLEHLSQGKGFSPVWFLRWILKLLIWSNYLGEFQVPDIPDLKKKFSFLFVYLTNFSIFPEQFFGFYQFLPN